MSFVIQSYYENLFKAVPKLGEGAFFVHGIYTHPEQAWPNNPSMWEYCHRETDTLVKFGILSQKALDALKAIPNPKGCGYDLWIQFPSKKLALDAFDAGMKAFGERLLLDFYIYNDGQLIAKEDS